MLSPFTLIRMYLEYNINENIDTFTEHWYTHSFIFHSNSIEVRTLVNGDIWLAIFYLPLNWFVNMKHFIIWTLIIISIERIFKQYSEQKLELRHIRQITFLWNDSPDWDSLWSSSIWFRLSCSYPSLNQYRVLLFWFSFLLQNLFGSKIFSTENASFRQAFFSDEDVVVDMLRVKSTGHACWRIP